MSERIAIAAPSNSVTRGTTYTMTQIPASASHFNVVTSALPAVPRLFALLLAGVPLLAMAVMYGFARYGHPARFPSG